MSTPKVEEKIHTLTKLPMEIREDLKNRKQWLEMGFIPIDPEKGGIRLRPNAFTSKEIKYYRSSEVRRGGEEELTVLRAPLKAHRRAIVSKAYQKKKERAQDHRERRKAAG